MRSKREVLKAQPHPSPLPKSRAKKACKPEHEEELVVRRSCAQIWCMESFTIIVQVEIELLSLTLEVDHLPQNPYSITNKQTEYQLKP
jgi:hypothetical protein